MRETYKRERKQNGRGREKADRKGREYRGTKVPRDDFVVRKVGRKDGTRGNKRERESKTEGCAGGCEKGRNKSAPSVKVIS